jgi:hypothetical protein
MKKKLYQLKLLARVAANPMRRMIKNVRIEMDMARSILALRLSDESVLASLELLM